MKPKKVTSKESSCKIIQNSDIFDILEKENIKYGLYSGTQISLLTRNRVSNDIDIMVDDYDFTRLFKLLPHYKYESTRNGDFIYAGHNFDIQIISKGVVINGDRRYRFKLTKLPYNNTFYYDLGKFKVRMLNIADTIILKSLLKRGSEQKKFDLYDIASLQAEFDIDNVYLKKRVSEITKRHYVLDLLGMLPLIEH